MTMQMNFVSIKLPSVVM